MEPYYIELQKELITFLDSMNKNKELFKNNPNQRLLISGKEWTVKLADSNYSNQVIQFSNQEFTFKAIKPAKLHIKPSTTCLPIFNKSNLEIFQVQIDFFIESSNELGNVSRKMLPLVFSHERVASKKSKLKLRM